MVTKPPVEQARNHGEVTWVSYCTNSCWVMLGTVSFYSKPSIAITYKLYWNCPSVATTFLLFWRCVYRASYCNVLMWRCVYRASYCNVLMWRCVYRASYCNVLMTNEMHNSYNQFLFRSFFSALHVSNESSRSSSGVRHNILYYTVQSVQLCRSA
jgi:hypothetical protein